MGSVEKLWLWFFATTGLAVGLFAPWTSGVGFRPGTYCGIALACIGVVVLHSVLVRGTLLRRVLATLYSLAMLATVFSALALLLPWIHAEPYEWTFLAYDRWICGGDPTRAAEALLSPWTVEILQWCYSSFYLFPVAVMVVTGLRRGAAVYDHVLSLMLFGFLLSYLGYLLWPTLPPVRILAYGVDLEGVWLAGPMRRLIDAAEVNSYDCFPSGHTMIALLALWVAYRGFRGLFWCLLPLVSGLIASTVMLRYHYLSDVIGGCLGCALTLWLAPRVVGAWPEAVSPGTAYSDGSSPAAQTRP